MNLLRTKNNFKKFLPKNEAKNYEKRYDPTDCLKLFFWPFLDRKKTSCLEIFLAKFVLLINARYTALRVLPIGFL